MLFSRTSRFVLGNILTSFMDNDNVVSSNSSNFYCTFWWLKCSIIMMMVVVDIIFLVLMGMSMVFYL